MVTPMGTPAATKPMNAGTALHEQNGVMTPSPAAITLPTPSRRPPSNARVRSIDMNRRRNGDREDDADQQKSDLDHVIAEEVQGGTRSALRGSARTS